MKIILTVDVDSSDRTLVERLQKNLIPAVQWCIDATTFGVAVDTDIHAELIVEPEVVSVDTEVEVKEIDLT